MSEPALQPPGTTEQVVGTDPEFVDAVERRFGPIGFDLAALSSNRVRRVPWFGPGSPAGEDALAESAVWQVPDGKLLWLNPGFGNIAPWVKKAKAAGEAGARVAVLLLLSSGNWSRNYVHGHAQVEALNGRMRFVGHKHLYPKDLMLVLYGPGFTPGFSLWQWKGARAIKRAPRARRLATPPDQLPPLFSQ